MNQKTEPAVLNGQKTAGVPAASAAKRDRAAGTTGVCVELSPLEESGREEVVALQVAPGQEKFIASNAQSLEQAAQAPAVARPFAIVAGGKTVGFAMLAFDFDNDDPADRYWLWRFMIGAQFQGKGYAAPALAAVLNYFRAHGADQVTLSTKPDNARALALYHKAGFAENGQMNDGEIVLKLPLEGSCAS